jgi:hypothetical protein
VLHPRFPALPKIGMTLAPFLLYRAVRPLVERVRRKRGFDLIDAHYFYPDGVAAAMLAGFSMFRRSSRRAAATST